MQGEYSYGYTLTKSGTAESSTLISMPDDGVIEIPVVEEDGSGIIRKIDAGKYLIQFYRTSNGITKNGSALANTSFTVTDTQKAPTIEMNNANITEAEAYDNDAIISRFNVNGASITSAANLKYTLAYIDSQIVGNTLWVKSITLHEYYGSSFIEHTVTLNSMLTIN